ncbi:MAG: hypothetical protein AVDCRST_MAG43-1935 [uncultured Thermomicrobiales bacterium]|uniref:Uncharacterized protein n=1 Tax=uncultured Thermomicrobiales bacterium TaxID=1645740 RepID=A0A6J4UZE4_9BACT|nr:MAG: hypothetical protein AVDCRST_MAG43-1935 [uncultured Thermomicrobiales bacterium]
MRLTTFRLSAEPARQYPGIWIGAPYSFQAVLPVWRPPGAGFLRWNGVVIQNEYRT